MQRGFIFYKQFIALFILFSLSSSMVFGQTKRKATVAEKEKEICANCWSGVIKYQKVLTEQIREDEPVLGTTNPKSERIVNEHLRSLEYNGKVVVDGSSGQPVANTKVLFN